MPKFRKTTLTEMYQFLNTDDWKASVMPVEFKQALCWKGDVEFFGLEHLTNPHIHTLEGPHFVSDGDWIAKGPKGEFYPIKDEVHVASYEIVE